MKSIELFAGAGGLALGLGLAGFEHDAVIEFDKWACDTIRENKASRFPLVKDWDVFEEDVRTFDFTGFVNRIDLVSGGPPCQPFSLGGKHRGHGDHRDMFPAAVQVVRTLAPKAFLFENVRGITRTAFANYFQYIILQLGYPEVTRKSDEEWPGHLARLERHKTSGKVNGLTYNVVARVLNAADHGVPQQRERVFIVGFRSDLKKEWSFPKETHQLDSLIHDQWVTGEYWERHGVPRRERPAMLPRFTERFLKMSQLSFSYVKKLKPWLTVRDALRGLPEPAGREIHGGFHNHVYQPGARVYPGHTGSPLDLPAKALKAGDHGVPGGENMMVMPDGSVRYFTVRESARLQTFPDGFKFHGSWSETMRQLGNAVPVALAQKIAASIATQLLLEEESALKRSLS
ncbi:MAG: DNA cytosine methyltransferase [Syntrophobacteraceae bacterium]|jgi:DNA (cytosine-5)-methyltransferase 1|nr:DNA cytosine methyltransferase [Syntrophobacteraceae bacterium]